MVDEPQSTLGKILHVRIHVFPSHINLTITLNNTKESFSEMPVKRQPIVSQGKYENIGFIYLRKSNLMFTLSNENIAFACTFGQCKWTLTHKEFAVKTDWCFPLW